MKNKLSKCVTGFCKSHRTQHSLMVLMIMLERWQNVLDKGEYLCVLFMDLSKPLIQLTMIFYWQKQVLTEFLITRVSNLMCSYIKNRKQRTQINKHFSSEKRQLQGFHKV